MSSSNTLEPLRAHEIPGTIEFHLGNGGLPKAQVSTPWSQAEVYLHGAQVTAFQKHGRPPLLFLSASSRFESGKAIRGGVPICFPWFGPRPGDVAHGFARITDWQVSATAVLPGGAALLRFRLPTSQAGTEWSTLRVEFEVTIADALTMHLEVSNQRTEGTVEFEACLHSYFAVGDVTAISIHGLANGLYLDKTVPTSPPQRSEEPVRITAQTDRTYIDSIGTVLIRDPVLQRTIQIEKSGSTSTVVWNPWTTQLLPDLGPDEYRRMVCVESGNVERNRVALAPGQTAVLKVVCTARESV